jgi:hypothetical protein
VPHNSRDPTGRWLAREISLTNQWNAMVVRIGEKRVCWHWIRLAHVVRPALLVGAVGPLKGRNRRSSDSTESSSPDMSLSSAAKVPLTLDHQPDAGATEKDVAPDPRYDAATPVRHLDFSEDDGYGEENKASVRAKGVIRALRRISRRLRDSGDDVHFQAYISRLLQSSLFENLHASEIFQYGE